MQPIVTIIIPISRVDYLDEVFDCLESLECDNSRTNLVAIVDGDPELYRYATRYVDNSKFTDKSCIRYETKLKNIPNVINDRRLRIADIHNQLKVQVGKCDFVLGIEDDTLIPEYALTNLLDDYELYPNAGFIEGVELGRWGVYYVGGWITDSTYETTKITSCMPPEDLRTPQEISAGGFYCFLTRKNTYTSHLFETYQNNSLGPDVNFGMSLKFQGFDNYIDWKVQCIHRNKDLSIYYPEMAPKQIEFVKKYNYWSYSIK